MIFAGSCIYPLPNCPHYATKNLRTGAKASLKKEMAPMIVLRKLNDFDKSYISVALSNVGIKARVRKFNGSIRIVFDGDRDVVIATLNAEGYRRLNGEITRFSFNGENELFIHGADQ